MTSKDVRVFWTATPFLPFVIRLIDGRSFVVRHPECIWGTESIRAVYLVDDAGVQHTINTAIIGTIEYQRSPATPVENQR